MLRVFVLIAVVFTNLGLKAEQCPAFSREQVDVMKKSYELGKPFDLGFTLAALALKESSAGRYLINAISSDYGVYQGNVKTICIQKSVYHDSFLCNQEIQLVVNDIDRASEHAIETLIYWREYHGKRTPDSFVYENMIRSYNRGFSFEDTDGDHYWKLFKKDYHTVKRCVELS